MNIIEMPDTGRIHDRIKAMSGRVQVELVGVHGLVAPVREYKNLLTNAHKSLVASWMAQLAPTTPSYIAVGTGAFTSYESTNQDTTAALKSSGADQQLAQGVLVDASNRTLYGILVYLKRIGSSAGSIWLELQTNSAGSPSGVLVTGGTSTAVAINGLSTSYDWAMFTFPSLPAMTAATTYHWVLKSSGYTYSAAVTEVDVGTDQSSPGYTGGQLKTYNGAAWSNYSPTSDACFRLIANPDATMTTILGEATRNPIASASLNGSYTARLVANFTNAQAVGRHGHIGLFNAASVGTMSAIAAVDIVKPNTQQLNVYWLITVN